MECMPMKINIRFISVKKEGKRNRMKTGSELLIMKLKSGRDEERSRRGKKEEE